MTGRRPVWTAGQTTCGVAASMTTSRTFDATASVYMPGECRRRSGTFCRRRTLRSVRTVTGIVTRFTVDSAARSDEDLMLDLRRGGDGGSTLFERYHERSDGGLPTGVARLKEILDKRTSRLSDVLEVERELSRVQGRNRRHGGPAEVAGPSHHLRESDDRDAGRAKAAVDLGPPAQSPRSFVTLWWTAGTRRSAAGWTRSRARQDRARSSALDADPGASAVVREETLREELRRVNSKRQTSNSKNYEKGIHCFVVCEV
jgi:hypothetical protein